MSYEGYDARIVGEMSCWKDEALQGRKTISELEAKNTKLREALTGWEKYDRESPERTPVPDYALKRILRGEARKATEQALEETSTPT